SIKLDRQLMSWPQRVSPPRVHLVRFQLRAEHCIGLLTEDKPGRHRSRRPGGSAELSADTILMSHWILQTQTSSIELAHQTVLAQACCRRRPTTARIHAATRLSMRTHTPALSLPQAPPSCT